MTLAYRRNPSPAERESLLEPERIIELYNEIRPALAAYLCACGLSHDHSEDIIQETFLRLVRHTANARADDNLKGWVFRVAYNLSMDLHRSERRWLRGKEPDPLPVIHERVDPAPNPEEMILLDERWTHFRAALSHLTPKQRECLLLRAKGLRYREIAILLGVSVQRVGELMQRTISLFEPDCRKK